MIRHDLDVARTQIRRLRAALKPLADIPLERDADHTKPDHIAAVDMATTPNHVRFARLLLSQTANYDRSDVGDRTEPTTTAAEA